MCNWAVFTAKIIAFFGDVLLHSKFQFEPSCTWTALYNLPKEANSQRTPAWIFPSYGYPFIYSQQERFNVSKMYDILKLRMIWLSRPCSGSYNQGIMLNVQCILILWWPFRFHIKQSSSIIIFTPSINIIYKFSSHHTIIVWSSWNI